MQETATGANLRNMLAEAAAWLEHNISAVNVLNVFPVPDGDTGTNMHHTMKSAINAIAGCSQEDIHRTSAVASAAARGALMGARGNSGIILSQILKGLSQGLNSRDSFGAAELAHALDLASEAAYKSVSRPVEGTMLTVIRRAAAAAKETAQRDREVETVLERAVQEAKAALRETPEMLPVLREAGVVDAGGQGLCLLLEGALFGLRGEFGRAVEQDLGHIAVHWLEQSKQSAAPAGEPDLGFCTEFVVERATLDVEAVERRLTDMGTSVIVAAENGSLKAHLHTKDPQAALDYGRSLGNILSTKIDDMDEQRRRFLEQEHQLAAQHSFAPSTLLRTGVAVVAISPGPGLDQVFRGLGATVVTGGQSMNPSVQDILDAVEESRAEEILLLPNNPNVILTAKEAAKLASKRVEVVPSKTVPQGVSAMMACLPDKDIETNRTAMTSAVERCVTGEVTRATRDATIGGVKVSAGRPIGLLNGELTTSGESETEVVMDLLGIADAQAGCLVTLYYGKDVSLADAAGVCLEIKRRFPEVETELIYGGQPHYSYILSIEL